MSNILHQYHIEQFCSLTLNVRLIFFFIFYLFLPLQQSSKVFKRHSSIIPSSHLLAEVQETVPSLDGNDFEPGQYHCKVKQWTQALNFIFWMLNIVFE